MFKEYFKSVEEESIRDNFVIVYELLDEVLDFGYPQTTEPAVLKSYITQQGHELNRPVQPVLPAITKVLFHGPLPQYVKNEIFLDVIERVNMQVRSVAIVSGAGLTRVIQMSPTGAQLSAEIVGKVSVNARLSGMPEVKVVLNDHIKFNKPRVSGNNTATDSYNDGNM